MSQGNTESSKSVGQNADPFPMDLVVEIFSWLPAKSVARFRCVSKQLASMLRRPEFTKLFRTRSSTRPRLLLAFERAGVWRFFSSMQPQNPYDKSLVVPSDFHIEFPPELHMEICCTNCRKFSCCYASGSIFFSGMFLTETSQEEMPVICNPNTGQYVLLPYLYRYRKSYGFLGFDPIDKQSKALFMAYPCGPDKHRILTVGAENASWRTIECPLRHDPLSDGICINGVLYYLGDHTDYLTDYLADDAPYDENAPGHFVIACFDVRSEEFKFVKAECCYDLLINYKGKLGGVSLDYTGDGEFPLKLSIWVLEDVEKQEWSKDFYTLWDENEVRNVEHTNLYVVGMTATGDIVICGDYTSNPFYVFYFNPERKTLQRVEIQGVGEFHQEFNSHEVYAFVDHIEDLNVIDAKHLKSSTVTKPRTKPHKRPTCCCGENKQPAIQPDV